MDELFDLDTIDDAYSDSAVGMTDIGCADISINDTDDMQT